MGVEQAMRRTGNKGGDLISSEELLLALNRSSTSLSMDEVRDFFNYVASTSGQKNDCVMIRDVI